MANLKGQDSGMAKQLVVIGVALIIGVFVYATVTPIISNDTHTNESVGYLNATGSAGGSNSQFLDFAPVISGTVTVYNSSTDISAQNTLTEGTDYSLALRTGEILNLTQDVRYIRATYDSGQLSTAASRTTLTDVDNNTFNGFSLAAIVVIVIAAAAILRSLGFF